MVGALLCEPVDPQCIAGVIFFNNVGYLGMCGHGTIGLVVTLAHMGRIQPGEHRIETPVGIVTARLNTDGSVSIENVPSYRKVKGASVQVNGRTLTGDIAWGGNLFFLAEIDSPEIELRNIDSLTMLSWDIRQALNTGAFPEVDHVELFTHRKGKGDSRNFVLCPGKAYDRSPCGTGTSAKLACLAADGTLREREKWIQESVIGSTFEASFRWVDRARGTIIPMITGRASVNAEATLILSDDDPFCWGIR